MTTQSLKPPVQSGESANAYSFNLFELWRSNYELLLAAITLVALLIGWIGGSLTGALPPVGGDSRRPDGLCRGRVLGNEGGD